MKLKPIIKNNYLVAESIKEVDGEVEYGEVEKFLKQKQGEKQFRSNVLGLLLLLKEYSKNGTKNLTSNHFHVADSDTNLYRFSKGRLRVYCKLDSDEKLILLTGALVKKTQPTEKQVIRHARKIWKQYELEKQKGTVEVIQKGTVEVIGEEDD